MEIHQAGSRPTRRAPKEYFTGTVWQDPVIQTEAPARLACNRVSFEPGARTAWHTHPLGQTLLVMSGLGRIQRDGGPVEEVRPGDIVFFEPDERHSVSSEGGAKILLLLAPWPGPGHYRGNETVTALG